MSITKYTKNKIENSGTENNQLYTRNLGFFFIKITAVRQELYVKIQTILHSDGRCHIFIIGSN